MEELKIHHKGCGGRLIHLYSNTEQDVFACAKCKKEVAYPRDPETGIYSEDVEDHNAFMMGL